MYAVIIAAVLAQIPIDIDEQLAVADIIVPAPELKRPDKPVITGWFSKTCSPCKRAKFETAKQSEFTFVWVEYDPQTSPAWIKGLPAMSWKPDPGAIQEIHEHGWEGMGKLRKRYRVELEKWRATHRERG